MTDPLGTPTSPPPGKREARSPIWRQPPVDMAQWRHWQFQAAVDIAAFLLLGLFAWNDSTWTTWLLWGAAIVAGTVSLVYAERLWVHRPPTPKGPPLR